MDARTKALIGTHIGKATWEQGRFRAAQLVQDAKDAEDRLTKVQWAWGDLSLEIIPLTLAGGDHSLAAVLVNAFNEDYKVPWQKNTMHSLRQTSAAWPKAKRKKTSFAVHKILKSHPDRFKIIRDGMTTAEAMAAVGRKLVQSTPTRASAIECANAAKSWTRALANRLDDEPSDDLKIAIGDAWRTLTEVAISVGIYDELIESLEDGLVG